MPDINETHGVYTPSAYIIPKYILLSPVRKVKPICTKTTKFIHIHSLTYAHNRDRINPEVNMRAMSVDNGKWTVDSCEAVPCYWLRLLHYTNYLTKAEFTSIYSDCRELERMLTAIVKTSKD